MTTGSFFSTLGKHAMVGLVCLASVMTLFQHFGNYDPPVSFLRAQPIPYSVEQGGTFNINWEVERTRRCGVRFDREIYADIDAPDGGTRIELADIVKEGGRPVASRDSFATEVVVPENMRPGRAKYISVGLYSCNLFQMWKPIIVPAPEVEFEVRPRSHSKPSIHSTPG